MFIYLRMPVLKGMGLFASCAPQARMFISNHEDIRSAGVNVINVFNDVKTLQMNLKMNNLKPRIFYRIEVKGTRDTIIAWATADKNGEINIKVGLPVSNTLSELQIILNENRPEKVVYRSKPVKLVYSPREKFVPENSRLFTSKNVFLKRTEDIGLSLVMAVPSLAVMFLEGLAVMCYSPGSPFFSGKRPGQNGKVVTYHKIRSMYFLKGPDTYIPANVKDPRIIRPVGKFIREYGIDELPQLLNVMTGEWSLIGPRAENILPDMIVQDKSMPVDEFMRVYTAKPGLTGLRMINGRDDPDVVENRITKFKLERHYIENWSWGMELGILLRTVPALLFKQGAPVI